MKEAGLDIPDAAKLCRALIDRGLSLPEDLYTQAELHDNLLRLWKEART